MFNSKEQLILGIIIFVYFGLLYALALIMQRNIRTYEDYNVAGRSVSILPLILTFVGTGVGGATLLGYSQNGYELGMGQMWIHITMFFAVILFASLLLKRIRSLGEAHYMVTIGDYTALRYGEKARIPTTISFLFSYCAMTGMQFAAVASILNLVLGLNMTYGILIGWALLTAKTYAGGLKTVVWQDVIQGTILIIGIFIMFFTVVKVSGSWSAMSDYAGSMQEKSMLDLWNITPSEIMIYLFTLAFYQFIRQDLWQRIWAAKSLATARSGYWLSMIIAVGIGAVMIAIGIMSRFGMRITETEPALIFYRITGEIFPFPLVAVMIIVLLAAVLSTADSFFIAGSSSVVNDLIKPHMKNQDEKRLVKYSKLSVLIVSVVSLVLALAIPGLVNLMVTGTAMAVSGLLAPVVLGMFWKKPGSLAGIGAMWIGLAAAIIWQVAGHPFGIHPIMIGLPLSIIVMLGLTFARPAAAEHAAPASEAANG